MNPALSSDGVQRPQYRQDPQFDQLQSDSFTQALSELGRCERNVENLCCGVKPHAAEPKLSASHVCGCKS